MKTRSWLSDLNRQVLCLAAAEVDGVEALVFPGPDPAVGPEAAAELPCEKRKRIINHLSWIETISVCKWGRACLCRRSWGVCHRGFLPSAQIHQALGAMSVEQVLCASCWRLRTSGVGDGGCCQAVLDVLVHIHSGRPRLPVVLKQKRVSC